MKKNKQTQYSLQKDMRSIYRGLYERFPEGFPEVFIFEELPGKEKILQHLFPDGRRAFFVENDTDEKILECLSEAIEYQTCDNDTTIPIVYHELNDEEVSRWLIYACYIADSLNISLRQIMFAHGEDSAGYSEEFITFINDDANPEETLMIIAHELRHAWQHIHHPEWYSDYIHPEEDEEAYYNQISEIDAEAFAIKVESMITGVDFISTYAGMDMNPVYRAKIIDQMNKIDVVLSKKKIKEIRNLINLDEILKG